MNDKSIEEKVERLCGVISGIPCGDDPSKLMSAVLEVLEPELTETLTSIRKETEERCAKQQIEDGDTFEEGSKWATLQLFGAVNIPAEPTGDAVVDAKKALTFFAKETDDKWRARIEGMMKCDMPEGTLTDPYEARDNALQALLDQSDE